MQFIHLVEGACSKESCNHFIDFFEKNINLAEPGGAGKKKLNNLEISLDIDFNNPSSFGLEFILSNMISQYKEKFPLIDSHLTNWHVTPTCQLAKYEPNNYYSYVHCENPGRPKYLSRVFAWMIYLNDVREGGYTEFPTQNKKFQPRRGDILIWPAYFTHPHRGIVSKTEKKYIVTGWYVFDS